MILNAERHAARIWSSSLATVLVLGAGTWGAYVYFYLPAYGLPAIAMALSLIAALIASAAFLVAIALSSKWITSIRLRRIEQAKPLLAAAVAEHLTGHDRSKELLAISKRFGSAIDLSLVELMAQLTGTGRERLLRLAQTIGVTDRVIRQTRSVFEGRRNEALGALRVLARPEDVPALKEILIARDERLKVEAARIILAVGSSADIEAVFMFCLRQPLSVRALLLLSLKPYALHLSMSVLPRILNDGDPKMVLPALEFLRAWQIFLPLPEIAILTSHTDATVREAAFHALMDPLSAAAVENRIRAGMADPVVSVQAAAVMAAGRLQINALEMALRQLYRQSADRDVQRNSALALARLQNPAERFLEESARSGGVSARFALEALEQIRLRPSLERM